MDKAPAISHEQTLRLIIEAQNGSREAADTLIRAHTALVCAAARRYLGRAEFEDLVQIGSLGLYKAICGFRPELGNRFSTYAVPLITGEIKRFLRDDGPLKVSRRLKELAARARAEARRLEAEGRDPCVRELAARLGSDPMELAAALEADAPCISTDEPLQGSGETTLGEALSAESGFEDDAVDRVYLEELLSKLENAELRLIALRFFRELTQKQTAREMGLSQAGVSRLEKKALEALRKSAES